MIPVINIFRAHLPYVHIDFDDFVGVSDQTPSAIRGPEKVAASLSKSLSVPIMLLRKLFMGSQPA